MKLFKHQQEIVDRFPTKHVLVWGTGSGKSLAALKLAEKTQQAILIICPKSLKNDWLLRAKEAMAGYRHDIYIFTKEEFRRDWETAPKCGCVIVDEAHYFFGMTSKMSKALEKYFKVHDVMYRYFLTATAFRSSPWDIYRMCVLLGYRLNYNNFLHRFFYYVPMGGRNIPMVRPGMEHELAELVDAVGTVVKLEDCADVPEQTFDIEYFELTKDQKKGIAEIDDPAPIVRLTKSHQICGGSLKGDGYVADKTFDCDKLDRLEDLANENPKMMVVCRYNNEIELIKERLGKDHDVFVINGDVSGKDRFDIVERCKKYEKYILIVNAACSEGYEVPTCPLMIFYSYSFSFKDYIQMLGRIQRINNLKKNTYLSLIVKGTVDERIYETITIDRQDFHAAIYES